MADSRENDGTIGTLQSVLDAMIDPINQLFFHSRMMRSWGHSLGMARNMEWIAKMQRTGTLALALRKHGAGPCSREACDLVIGRDPASILASDADQTRWFLEIVERATESCSQAEDRQVLEGIADAERADLARLEGWIRGPEAEETPKNAKFLLPKPGSTEHALNAINAVLPAMTSSVSQVFHHSLIFKGTGHEELADRELNLAVVMMYRSEAMLERLLDLGGTPDGRGHGKIMIGDGERGSDETALDAFDTLIPTLDAVRQPIVGYSDPTTHTLLDGIARALRDDRAVIAARLAA
jgi:bacterioferritin (cytochrome b1)